jgi:hypothetical protein
VNKKNWYHGTNHENSGSIAHEGLRVGTWLAAHLEDALAFGGPYVLEVELDESKFNGPPEWQVHTLEHIPPERIVSIKFYRIDVLKERPSQT